MGKVRCKLSVMPHDSFEIDTAPQLDYVTFIHTEEAFTTFVNACAQAGAAKCLLVQMIGKKKATGHDVRTLITSTIDVSLFTPASVS